MKQKPFDAREIRIPAQGLNWIIIGEKFNQPGECRAGFSWRPQRDSNPRCHLERVES